MKYSVFILSVFVIFALSCTRQSSKATGAKETELPSYASYKLVDENGKTFSIKEMKGKPLFVSFIFTRCGMQDQCPLTMRLNKQLYKKVRAQKKDMRFLVVTIDPEFDTPSVMKNFGKSYDLDVKSFTFATGEEQTIADFASELANVVGLPGAGIIAHNLKSVLLDSDLNLLAEFKDNEWKPDQVLSALN